MANSKFKCSSCKEYFPQAQKIKTNGGNFCSKECGRQKQNKRQANDFKKSKERKSGAPTVEQERAWLDQIAQFVASNGSYPRGSKGKWQHHHLFGRKARHAGQEIGRWAVLPIEFKYHDISSSDPKNITNFPKNYVEAFGSDIHQFLTMCQEIEADQGRLEIPQDILETIAGLS